MPRAGIRAVAPLILPLSAVALQRPAPSVRCGIAATRSGKPELTQRRRRRCRPIR